MSAITKEKLEGWYNRKDSTDREIEAQQRAEDDEEVCQICDGSGEVMSAPDRNEGGELKDAEYRICECKITEDDNHDEEN